MVAIRSKSRSYTVIVCRYIMFWATNTPVWEATTDLGEMSPPMVWSGARTRSAAVSPSSGTSVVVVVGGIVVVVVVLVLVVLVVVTGAVVVVDGRSSRASSLTVNSRCEVQEAT